MPGSPFGSFNEIISAHARHRPRQRAIVSAEGIQTWQAFEARTRRVSQSMLEAELQPGDRVALLMVNGAAMAEVIVACLRAGLIAVPLNPTVTQSSLAAMIADAGARVVIVSNEYRDRLDEAVAVHRILAGGDALGWVSYSSWQESSSDRPLPPVSPESACNIIYSSGTTGRPKGIVHSHRARLDWAYDIAVALRFSPGARTLMTIGLYSNISWAGILATLLVGGTLFIHQGFDPERVLETVERERITNMAVVPILCARLIESETWSRTDKSSLIGLMSCGATLPVLVKQRLMAELPAGVIELYGLTEGIATTLEPDDAEGRISSVGRPITGSTVAILDEDGNLLTEGVGEVIGRSRYVMDGYWNLPELTSEAIWIDEQGLPWLRTGDVGRIDSDGFLSIVDRKKDMIISGGQNIYPADIEAVLASHPLVADCAVIGVPDEVWGETPLALVVLREGAEGAAVQAWANERLGRRERLARIEVREELPRNANGKIVKKDLRQPYWAEAAAT
ncbi:MAG: AMP-binding protein [Sphingomonas sp.]|uniref:class I adenylate-forming enzyme family protein n=1 Tax=Sphingomonas sp. TaxID=28214 RepID=UPI002625FBF4|nr:AMP-binding protein [Sphingomonas sp.]MDK2768104.1 AMP-binding protein [Sphingomonas sp.]